MHKPWRCSLTLHISIAKPCRHLLRRVRIPRLTFFLTLFRSIHLISWLHARLITKTATFLLQWRLCIATWLQHTSGNASVTELRCLYQTSAVSVMTFLITCWIRTLRELAKQTNKQKQNKTKNKYVKVKINYLGLHDISLLKSRLTFASFLKWSGTMNPVRGPNLNITDR